MSDTLQTLRASLGLMVSGHFRAGARGLGELIAGKSNSAWLRMWGAGKDMDGGGGMAPELSSPYQSPWAFRAVQHVASPVMSAPLQFLDANARPVIDREQTAFWKQPCYTGSGLLTFEEFIETTVAWMLLNGQALWVLDDTWIDRKISRKSPIFIAKPNRLIPMRHVDELLGWYFTDASGQVHHLLPEQVVRPRFINPWESMYGAAPWEAAEIAARADYAGAVFAKNVADNNGDRGVYVIAKGAGPLDDAQRQQIEMNLRQKRELNRRGIYKATFITGDVSIEDPKVQSVDAAFVEQRAQNRHEIFIALGVPASMADLQASYSAGSASDRFRLMEESCIPIANRIAACIDKVELRRGGPVATARFYFDDHPVMQEVRMERAKVADQFIGRGMPVSIASQWLGLGIPEYDQWNVGYLPMSLQPVSRDGMEADTESEGTEPANEDTPAKRIDSATKRMEKLFRELKTAPAPELRSEADPEAEKLWLQHMKLRAASEKAVKTQFNKCLMEAREETLRKLAAAKQTEGIETRGLLEIMFDLAKFTVNLIARLNPALGEAMQSAAAQLSEELGLADPWTVEDPAVTAFLNERENRIKGMAEHVWQDVAGSIQDGLKEGESNAKIAQRVRDTFTGLSKDRATTIAQTEVSAAYGDARQKGMKANGIQFKKWLTARDEKVRASHHEVDGEIVPVDATFDVGGEPLLHPGDPHGSAENVINCRCVCVAARQPKE